MTSETVEIIKAIAALGEDAKQAFVLWALAHYVLNPAVIFCGIILTIIAMRHTVRWAVKRLNEDN